MTTPNNNAPSSFEKLVASVPKEMRSSPLSIGKFFDFMAVILKSQAALKQRIAQLEQQASGNGEGHD